MPVGVAQSQLVPQRLDTHRTPALFAAQRWEAVGLELARNGLQRPARRSQFLHAGTDVGIVRALPIASNRTHEHTFRLAASRPGDADLHLLARALRLDLTRSTTWRMTSLRSAAVVVGAFHRDGISAASRRMAARSSRVRTRGCCWRKR